MYTDAFIRRSLKKAHLAHSHGETSEMADDQYDQLMFVLHQRVGSFQPLRQAYPTHAPVEGTPVERIKRVMGMYRFTLPDDTRVYAHWGEQIIAAVYTGGVLTAVGAESKWSQDPGELAEVGIPPAIPHIGDAVVYGWSNKVTGRFEAVCLKAAQSPSLEALGFDTPPAVNPLLVSLPAISVVGDRFHTTSYHINDILDFPPTMVFPDGTPVDAHNTELDFDGTFKSDSPDTHSCPACGGDVTKLDGNGVYQCIVAAAGLPGECPGPMTAMMSLGSELAKLCRYTPDMPVGYTFGDMALEFDLPLMALQDWLQRMLLIHGTEDNHIPYRTYAETMAAIADKDMVSRIEMYLGDIRVIDISPDKVIRLSSTLTRGVQRLVNNALLSSTAYDLLIPHGDAGPANLDVDDLRDHPVILALLEEAQDAEARRAVNL